MNCVKTTLFCFFSSQLFIPFAAFAQQDSVPAKDANIVEYNEDLPEIIITGGLRAQPHYDEPSSVSFLSEQQVQDNGAEHFGSLIAQLPNLQHSGETARPRYIQIRGIGERSEYTGAPNASVGMVIDGIDFSGIGGIGSTLDVKQVEVFRGPQGTKYGANALGGLVNIVSNDPTRFSEHAIETRFGSDNLRSIQAVASGPIKFIPQVNYRFAVSQYSQDGYRDNAFLNRSDTNGLDEFTLRGKLKWENNLGSELTLTYLHADYDNGYDAFTLDNSLTTLSDEPGEDDQKTNAFHIKARTPFERFVLLSNTSYADSDLVYSYDADWVYSGFWDESIYGYDYSAFFENQKQRETYSQEFRIASKPEYRIFNQTTDWVTGVYFLHLDEVNQIEDTFSGQLNSRYEALNSAIFTQFDTRLTDKWKFTSGVRFENRHADYDDSNAQSFSPEDNMLGGQLALQYQASEYSRYYASIARGYKAGGFNPIVDEGFPQERRFYEPEYLTNYELGWHYFNADSKLSSNVSVFYMDRQDLQVDGSQQLENGAFIYFIENLEQSYNYGAEFDINWQFDPAFKLDAALGLLHTEFENYTFKPRFNEPIDISGRQQAHAPNYQFNIGLQYEHAKGYFARGEFVAVDKFYFSNSHNQQSNPYEIVNARIGYKQSDWMVSLWVNNVFNERYATRGFYFANDPNFTNVQQYIRLGNPRQVGVTLRYQF